MPEDVEEKRDTAVSKASCSTHEGLDLPFVSSLLESTVASESNAEKSASLVVVNCNAVYEGQVAAEKNDEKKSFDFPEDVLEAKSPKDAVDSTTKPLEGHCTGNPTEMQKKSVAKTAPLKDSGLPFVVGVNHLACKANVTVVSNASCSTQCVEELSDVLSGVKAKNDRESHEMLEKKDTDEHAVHKLREFDGKKLKSTTEQELDEQVEFCLCELQKMGLKQYVFPRFLLQEAHEIFLELRARDRHFCALCQTGDSIEMHCDCRYCNARHSEIVACPHYNAWQHKRCMEKARDNLDSRRRLPSYVFVQE